MNQQQQKLHEKIKLRENISLKVAEMTNKLKSREKQELIHKNESDLFFIYKNKHDPIYQRALERRKRSESVGQKLARWIKKEKPEVVDYYKNCVEYLKLI
jgi:hypothetical protein